MLLQKSYFHPAVELVCSGVVNAIWAIFFGVYTNEQLPNCINLYYWARIFLYVSIVSTVVYFFLIPFVRVEPANPMNYALLNRTESSSCAKIVKFIKYILGFASLVCYAYLWEKYLEDESCGELRSLVFTYLLIIGIILCICLALILCVCMVTLCCIGMFVNTRVVGNPAYEIPDRV